MLNSKLLPTILILFGLLSSAVYAETTSNKFSPSLYQDLNSSKQDFNYRSFDNRSIINTQAKIDKVKLGMAFTPEDLVTITNKNVHINYFLDQLDTVENGNKIIGFYIKSFF